jgi:HEAT repeat protein
MASNKNIRLQIDALHYLALTADPENRMFIQEMLNDKNEQIRDAAEEALETLQELLS